MTASSSKAISGVQALYNVFLNVVDAGWAIYEDTESGVLHRDAAVVTHSLLAASLLTAREYLTVKDLERAESLLGKLHEVVNG